MRISKQDAVVVGGGLSGLAVASYLARAGMRVTVLERSGQLGGRAASQRAGEHVLNLGPHALYRRHHATAVLDELGVSYAGSTPPARGLFALRDGALTTLPSGPGSIFTSKALAGRSRLETLRFFVSTMLRAPRAEPGQTAGEWLATRVRHAETRALLGALFRVATYANAPELMSAAAALAQLRLAVKNNVLYLHGGWQSLADGLAAAAAQAGVEVRTGVAVRGIAAATGGAHAVDCGEERFDAPHVVVTGLPASVVQLVPSLSDHVADLVPVRAAALDVALSALPRPDRNFVLGLDEPLYYSVHSARAALAPAGGATLHLAKYLEVGRDHDAEADRRKLEDLLDLAQPGWREHLVKMRFLPAMDVTGAVVTGSARPDVDAAGIDGIWIAGDWVGPDGMLADAALASARRAAAAITTRSSRGTPGSPAPRPETRDSRRAARGA